MGQADGGTKRHPIAIRFGAAGMSPDDDVTVGDLKLTPALPIRGIRVDMEVGEPATMMGLPPGAASLGALRIIEDQNLTIDGPPVPFRLSWRQRLLSWPWRPWRATIMVPSKIPNPDGYIVGPNRIVMHPATAAALKRELRAREEANYRRSERADGRG